MEGRMSWYHALLKAPKCPSASQALLWGYFCIAGGGHRHPSQPCHKNEKKAGLTKQHEECRGTTRNIMMSWSWKLAACTRIPWDIEEYLRIGWSISPRGISLHILENLRMWVAWNIMMSWSAVEAHCILYWNTLKIVEYRGISWNAMKNHDVMVCLGSSLNILEYHWILRNMMEWRMSWYHASLKVP